MHKVVYIPVEALLPTTEAVLKAQGVPGGNGDERMHRLAGEAISTVRRLASPSGVLLELPTDEFEGIYMGEGMNDNETPLALVYPQATNLALFAVTLGPQVGDEISRLFSQNDFAVGTMLDAAASEATELAAQYLESQYRNLLTKAGSWDDSMGVLPFSPGYCGWNVSGQKKLFAHLKPETIGITLTGSCLMQPLKSISGVFVSGKMEIFMFDDTYPFCADCRTHSCQTRARAVRQQLGDDWT